MPSLPEMLRATGAVLVVLAVALIFAARSPAHAADGPGDPSRVPTTIDVSGLTKLRLNHDYAIVGTKCEHGAVTGVVIVAQAASGVIAFHWDNESACPTRDRT